MSLIDHIIPQQRWERIRDQIYTVLKNEFDNQVYLYPSSPCVGCTFWAERNTNIDKSESGIIIINTFKGNYIRKFPGASTTGTYQFVLDFMVNGIGTAASPGEKIASFRLQRLMGIVRYILEHQNYIVLGFTEFFIEHTEVTNFQIYIEDRKAPDASNTAIGQIIFTVTAEEITTPNGGVMIARSTTDAFIAETDKGYQYIAYHEQ